MRKPSLIQRESIKNSPTLRSQLYRKRVLTVLKETRKKGPLASEMAKHSYAKVSENPDFVFAHERIPIKDINTLMRKSEGVEAVLKKLDKIAPEDHLKIFEALLDSYRSSNDRKSKFELFSQYFNKFKLETEVMLDTLIQKEKWYLVFAVFDKFKSLGIPRIVEKFRSAKQYGILLDHFHFFKGVDRAPLMQEILDNASHSTIAYNSSKLTPEEKNAFFLKRAKNSEDKLRYLAFDLDKFRGLSQEVAEMFPLDVVIKNLPSFSHLSWDFAKKLIKDLASDEKISSNYNKIDIGTKFMKNLWSFDVELNQVLETMMETESLAYILAIKLNHLKPLLKWEKLSDEFAQKLLDSQSDTYQKREVLISISKNASLFDSWKKWEKAKNLR